MISKILNLNFIYIISAIFFSTLIILGYNKNSYLFNSGVEIIILNLLFIFVVLNSYKENVFIKFYIFYFYIFYLLNIFFVCLPGYESYFIQKEGSILSVNKSINTLSLHFLSIFILIRFIFKNNSNNLLDTTNNRNLYYLIISCFILAFFSILSLYLINSSISASPLFKILSVVFSFDRILLILVSILFIFWNKINIRLKIISVFSIILLMLFDFLSGSKSSIFFLFLVIIFCFFYLDNKNLISIKLAVIFLILSLFSLIAFFFAVNSLVEINNINDVLAFFNSFLKRVGFFEFYLDKNNSSSYNEVMSLSYNLKAFLDKITPGFDPYGIPLMKNQLHFLWHYHENMVFRGVVSEQSTLFAISNRIFHYYYILYYFLIIVFFKFLYEKISFIESEKKAILQVSVLYLFWIWLDGFGIDYFLMIVTYQIIFLIFLFTICFTLKKIFK